MSNNSISNSNSYYTYIYNEYLSSSHDTYKSKSIFDFYYTNNTDNNSNSNNNEVILTHSYTVEPDGEESSQVISNNNKLIGHYTINSINNTINIQWDNDTSTGTGIDSINSKSSMVFSGSLLDKSLLEISKSNNSTNYPFLLAESQFAKSHPITIQLINKSK